MTKEERIIHYDRCLTTMGITGIEFSITDKFCENFFVKFVLPETKLGYLKPGGNTTRRMIDKTISRSINYVKLNLLQVKYKRNNFSAKGIKEGFVYAITNPAFSGWIKVGSAIDVYERLNTYQTYSPLRDFELIDYYFSYNRRAEESMYHKKYDANNEWIKESELFTKDFGERKIRSRKHISFD